MRALPAILPPAAIVRGHMDLGVVVWIIAILGAIAFEKLYRYRTGESLLAQPWVWIALGVAAALVVSAAAWRAYRKRPRVRIAEGRTLVLFDGRRFEAIPGEIAVERWTSGGAFGQPLRSHMSLSRGGEVLYQGLEEDAERLLAALNEAARAP